MSEAAGASWRVFALGRFTAPPVAAADLEAAFHCCADVAQLPALGARDIVCTDLPWLDTLAPAARAALAARARPAAAWVGCASGVDASVQLGWLRAGIHHLFDAADFDVRLAALVAQLRDRADGAPLRVLLLDGDASLSAHADALGAAGMQVLAIDDCLRLAEALERHDPDVLLTGAAPPGCGLAELATLVRQWPRWAALPLLSLDAAGAPAAGVINVAAQCLPAEVEAHGRRHRVLRRRALLARQRQCENEAHFEQLRRTIDEHAIVSVTDIGGNIIRVNDKFCAVSGYRRDELIGRNHRMLKSMLHPAPFYAALWRTISAGRAWHGELCNRRKNGELYWVEASIVPHFDASGVPYQYVSMRTEITPLKHSEERLRHSQIFANIGTWDWDIQSGHLYWSERIAPLFGYPGGELQTSYANFMQAVHPDDRAAVAAAVAACIERDAPYEIEHRVVWPDGSVRWLLERGAVQRDGAGRALRMLGVVQDIDQRKQTELALLRSERLLRQAQALAHLGNWQANLETGDMVWSEEVYRIFGRDPATFTPGAAAFFDAVHPDDAALARAARARAAGSGVHDVAHRIVCPDGAVRHVHQLARAECAPDGRLLRLSGTVQDVTERVEAEARLHESERRFSFAVEGAGDGIWDWDIGSDEMLFSGHYETMLGHARGTLEPRLATWVGSIHPDDLGHVQRQVRDYLAGKIALCVIELRMRCADGGYKWILCRSTVVARDGKGAPTRMIGIHSDVSDRKAAELKLAARESLLSAILSSTRQGFWFVDRDGVTTDLNPSMCAILGYARADVLGRNIVDFVDAPNAAILRRALASRGLGGCEPYEVALARPDGRNVFCLNNPTVLYDQHGMRTGSVGIFTDISELKKAHRELAQFNLSLSAAREAAERANQAKSDFLSSMSHELRTPMNAIIGFAQMLEYDDGLNPDQQDNVQEVLKAGRHLLQLINEVLDLAKIESGRIDLSLEPVALAAIVEECRHLIEPLAHRRQLSLQTAIGPLLAVRADRVRFKQVLLNVLSNAVKYNRDAGSIRVSAADAGPGRLRIVITDTGSGIAPARMSELFQPFSRLDAEQGEVEGTGIGLTITRRLMELMGGEIGVSSELGVGSTFWLDLPSEAPPGVAADAACGTDGEAAGSATRALRALCIDDNPTNLKLIKQMLGRRPHIGLLASHNPELALELARGQRPNLILLDINMPGIDGYQVLALLRAQPALAAIPVIAITANAMPHDIERGLAAGFAAYLTKPLDVSLFLHTVDRCLAPTEENPK